MDIYLHIGAHRTATTSFQHYLRENRRALGCRRIGAWGPDCTRQGLFHGVIPVPSRKPASVQLSRARGRVALATAALAKDGIGALVISDENMMGSLRGNLRDMRLYPGVGERMARFHACFGGDVRRVMVGIRAPEAYWTSALCYSLTRIGRVPCAAELGHIARAPRSWREVITDLACAMPGTEIVVTPHEALAGQPEARLAALLGRGDVPRNKARAWCNARPGWAELRAGLADRGAMAGLFAGAEDTTRIFNTEQSAAMAEAYADDLYWLRAGADGLARICEESALEEAGINPACGAITRGRYDGKDEPRRMA